MASVYDLKPRFQALLRPLVNALAASGVTANQVTIAAVVLSLAGGGLIAWRPFEAWPLLLLPLNFYTSVFHNTKVGDILRYNRGEEPDKEGTIKHAAFTLEEQAVADAPG